MIVLSSKAAAKTLKCSVRTLEDWRYHRKGPVYLKRSDHIQNEVYYTAKDIFEFKKVLGASARGSLKPRRKNSK